MMPSNVTAALIAAPKAAAASKPATTTVFPAATTIAAPKAVRSSAVRPAAIVDVVAVTITIVMAVEDVVNIAEAARKMAPPLAVDIFVCSITATRKMPVICPPRTSPWGYVVTFRW